MQINKKCENCIHHHRSELDKITQCKKNAPVVFPIVNAGQLNFVSTWPNVKDFDWCSQFEENKKIQEIN